MKKRSLVSLLLCLAMLLSMTTATAESSFGDRYPLVDEPVTYTAVFVNNYIAGDPNEVMPLIKRTTEISGVTFEWTVLSTSDRNTQRSLMLADGNIPDVSFGLFDDKSVMMYGSDLFLPLEDLIPTAMPNFKSFVDENEPWLWNSLTMSDGHIYTLPKIGAPNVPHTNMVEINKTWLEKLGLEMPTTTDELFDVLVAFKEQDPNGNGKQDEIPFTMAMGDWERGNMEAWWGITREVMFRDGKVYYSPYTEEYKTMLQWMNKCWEAGLIDIELFTQDDATFNAKAREGLYGVYTAYAANTHMSEEQAAADYETLMLIDGGTEYWGAYRSRPDSSYTVLNKGVISAECENPEILLAALDLWYNTELGIEATYGPIGTTIGLDENGAYRRLTENVPEGYATMEAWTNTFHWNQWPSCMTYDEKTEPLLAAYDRLEQYAYAEKAEASGRWVNEPMPYAFMSIEESDVINGYYTDLDKYVDEMYALFVTGERDIDTEWDAYIAQLEKLHVKEYIEAYQGYYDRICK